MKFYCATGNAGKLKEFQLAAAHAPVDIELLPNFRDLPQCIEDGATFEENAIKKARYYGVHAPAPTEPQRIPVQFDLPNNFADGQIITIETPLGPLNAKFQKIRGL